MIVENLVVFLVSCLLLILAGGLLVRSLTRLGAWLGISGFILSFVIMAFSTSLPELLVGIKASMLGTPELALGTIIGSNIANVTLVAGVTALLARGFKTTPLIRKNAYSMVGIVVLATLLTYLGGQLSKSDGVILLFVLAVYMYFMISRHKKSNHFPNKHSKWQIISAAYLLPVSVVLLYFSAQYVVDSGIAIAGNLDMPVLFVGMFFIALGTSLPELVFDTRAALTGRSDLAMGDLIGSVVINSTLVLAVVASIHPFTASSLFYLSSFFMIVVCLLFAIMCESYDMIDWKEGLVLVLMYVLFVMVEFTVRGLV